MSRLAIVLPFLGGGGAERVMITLANEFAHMGHEVQLIVFRSGGVYSEEVGEGVSVRNLNSGRVLKSFVPLVKYLRRARPDAVLSVLNHVNLLCLVSGFFIRPRLRLVISERNSPKGELSNGSTAMIIRLLMKGLYRDASAVIAVSDGVADQLREDFGLPANRVFSIPNPVDIQSLSERARCGAAGACTKRGRRTVAAMGRLEAQKDFSTLIRAFSIVATVDPDVDLIILGEGSLRKNLSDLANASGHGSRIHLLGFQANPFPWLATADVFVLSSQWEGFPNVILQALALNLRVVSTECETGPSEILSGGDGQRLVPVGDPQTMAKAILAELSRSVPPQNSGAVTQYAPPAIARQYVKVLLREND